MDWRELMRADTGGGETKWRTHFRNPQDSPASSRVHTDLPPEQISQQTA